MKNELIVSSSTLSSNKCASLANCVMRRIWSSLNCAMKEGRSLTCSTWLNSKIIFLKSSNVNDAFVKYLATKSSLSVSSSYTLERLRVCSRMTLLSSEKTGRWKLMKSLTKRWNSFLSLITSNWYCSKAAQKRAQSSSLGCSISDFVHCARQCLHKKREHG